MPMIDTKRRVLFITSNTCIGGVETILLNYLRAIDRSKYHTTVIVTELKGQLEKEYKAACDEMIFLDSTDAINIWLNNHHYHVTHVYNSIQAIQIIKNLPGIKVISTFGDFSQPFAWFKIRRDAFIANMSSIDYMTTDNLTGLKVFDFFPYYVTNAVDTCQDRNPPTKDERSVVWIGRDSGEKRIGFLANIAQRMPDIHFYCAVAQLAPPSEDYKRLRAFKNVTIAVNAPHQTIMTFCRKAKVYLSTSMTEGTPVSMIEALSCGCAPVVTDVGGMPGVVQFLAISGAPSGRVVPVEGTDIERAIRDSIASYHPIIAERQMEVVRDTYSIKRYVDNMDRMYSEVLPRRPKSELIMRLSQSHKTLPMDDRLLAFSRSKPWEIESNMEFGRKLYVALFDVELDSSPFWFDAVKNGYTRANFVINIFRTPGINTPRANAVRDGLLKELRGRTFKDDDPSYYPKVTPA